LQLAPNTTQLLLRQVDFDWKTKRDTRISIERIGRPAERIRPSADDLQKRLQTLSDEISKIPAAKVKIC
jgi:hypothetical protein